MSEQSVFPLLAKARLAVMGVVVAKNNDNITDAHLVLSSYMQEAKADGYRSEQAWSQLFAASVLMITSLVECRATHHDQSIDEAMEEIGLCLAEFGLTHG